MTMTKDDNNLVPGDVVAGLEASELVEIQRIAPFGSKTLVEGIGFQSWRLVKRPLTQEELAALVKVRGQEHTFDGDARLFLRFLLTDEQLVAILEDNLGLCSTSASYLLNCFPQA